MQKTHCRDCQGTELYDTVLSARNGVIIGRKTRSGDEWILVRCLVCLACGFISPYLDEGGVERVRGWAYTNEPPTPYQAEGVNQAGGVPAADVSNPVPKQDGAGFGLIVILCIIIGTALGVLGIVYGMMHQQQ